MSSALAPGFADPVLDQQAAFRALMDALARPGKIMPYANTLAASGAFSANAAGIALTLLDFEVRFHLSPSIEAAAAFITFHTGSEPTPNAAEADFAFVDLNSDALDLSAFRPGVPDYPDRSTTIIALSPGLTSGPQFRLCGPGIAGVQTMAPQGLPADFVAQWQANAQRTPLGVDLVLVSAQGVLGLPRSTRIIEEVR